MQEVFGDDDSMTPSSQALVERLKNACHFYGNLTRKEPYPDKLLDEAAFHILTLEEQVDGLERNYLALEKAGKELIVHYESQLTSLREEKAKVEEERKLDFNGSLSKLTAYTIKQSQKIKSLESRLVKTKEALVLILPLAKGYVASHAVGSNQSYIEQAETIASGGEG